MDKQSTMMRSASCEVSFPADCSREEIRSSMRLQITEEKKKGPGTGRRNERSNATAAEAAAATARATENRKHSKRAERTSKPGTVSGKENVPQMVRVAISRNHLVIGAHQEACARVCSFFFFYFLSERGKGGRTSAVGSGQGKEREG